MVVENDKIGMHRSCTGKCKKAESAGGQIEIQQKTTEYLKWLVAASKYVSSNDFWLSFILSEQIFPSNKTIPEMNIRTSPVGGREEAISFENEPGCLENITRGRVPDCHAQGARRGRVPDCHLRGRGGGGYRIVTSGGQRANRWKFSWKSKNI